MKFDPERVLELARVIARTADDAKQELENLVDEDPDSEAISWIGEHILSLFTDCRELIAYIEGGACCCKSYAYPSCDNVVSKIQDLVQKDGPFCEFCKPVMEKIPDWDKMPFKPEELKLAEIRRMKRYHELQKTRRAARTSEEEQTRLEERQSFWSHIDAKRKERLQELRDESEELDEDPACG